MPGIEEAVRAACKAAPNIEIKRDEPLRDHTSFNIGGPVRAMFFPKSAGELSVILPIFSEHGIVPLILGNGTNILASDEPHDIVAVKTAPGLCGIERTGETEITAGSGAPLHMIAVFAAERGLAGLEFAHGIPGTLGGAVAMNAGAYGGEMKDVVLRTSVVDPTGMPFEVAGDRHGFSYRRSVFSDSRDIIVSSVIRLSKGDAGEIGARMEELMTRRRQSQPLQYPSAGSTFKRPKNGYAAALIEEAGLKGYAVGGAMVSEKHAGFVVNAGGATFCDVVAVMRHVRETVQLRFGIELEPEVKIIETGYYNR